MSSSIDLDDNKKQILEDFIRHTHLNVENAIVYLSNDNWNLNNALDSFKKEKQIEENKNGGILNTISNLFSFGFCKKDDDLILTNNNQNKKNENNINNNYILNFKTQNNIESNINLNVNLNNNSFKNNDNLNKNNNIINISDNNIDNNFTNNISNYSINNESNDEFNINTNSKKNNFNDNNLNLNDKFFQDENLTQITFKFQDKKDHIIRKFLRTDTVQSLYDFINENLNNKNGKNKKKKFFLVRPYPYQIYNNKNKTLEEAGLDQNPVLHIRDDD